MLAGTPNIARRVCARSSCLRIRGDGDGEGGGAGIATGSQEVEHALIPYILPPLMLSSGALLVNDFVVFPLSLFFLFLGVVPAIFAWLVSSL